MDIFPLSIFIDLYFLTPFLIDFGTDSDFRDILSFLKKSLLMEGPFVIKLNASSELINCFLLLHFLVLSLFALLF